MTKRFFILGLSLISLQCTLAATGTTITESWSTITGDTIEKICTTQVEPVCNKEGKMYSNSCLAWDQETSFDYCKKPVNLSNEKELIQRAYTNHITKFNSIKSFQWSYPVTRAQAAKMLATRWKLIYPEIGQTSKLACKFSDIQNQPSDLQDAITQSCQFWLFQWYQWRFMPTQYITKGQLLTVLQRIVGAKYANTQHRPEKVFSRQAFYETAGTTANNSIDRLTFVTILAHSYNILSDDLSFNSSIW